MDQSVKQHRNRMMGLWAAELLGLIGKAAHDYAQDLAHLHEQHADDEPVVKRLSHDLRGKVSAAEIREKLSHFVAEAKRQLHKDGQPKDGAEDR